MKVNRKNRPLIIVTTIYCICLLFRALEYFVLRTDQTVLGEAFVHKLLGIAILFACMKLYHFKPSEIGFVCTKAICDLLKGLAFGIGVFLIAYTTEILILVIQGNFESLGFYVSAYAVDGNVGNQTAFVFFVICFIGNIINVVMEEGVFRGLFQKILAKKYSFLVAAVIASAIFGFWHIMSPLRSYCDGVMGLGGFAANSVMLVVTSGLVGFKFALMTKLTGNLYMAMGDHFLNNTIVNVLHVISDAGADQMQVVRIAVAQSVSFAIVLAWYLMKKRRSDSNGI